MHMHTTLIIILEYIPYFMSQLAITRIKVMLVVAIPRPTIVLKY